MNRWKDWHDQGVRDLERARLDLEHGYYEWACFTSQQAAEKVVKAVGLHSGITLWGHSLSEILNIVAPSLEVPEAIRESGQLLDLYYIPSRYPNGFAAGKPADYFNRKKAQEAIDAAYSIIGFCKRHLPGDEDPEQEDS